MSHYSLILMKKLSKKEVTFLKNLFLTTILGGIIGVLNYLFNIFVARYTDKDIFSVFSSALGIIYLLQIPATAIQSLMTKQVAKNKENNLNYFKWYSLLVFSILGIIFSLVLFFFKNPISQSATIPINTIVFLALTFLFAFISPVPKGLLLGQEKISTVNIILLLETILKFTMGVVAIKMDDPVPLLILANSLPAILSTIVITPFIKFKSKSTKRIDIDYKELLLMSISFFLLTTPFTLPLILVNPIFRAEYGAVTLLGKLVYFASVITASVMFARLSNEDIEKDRKRSLYFSLALSGLIGISLSFFFFLFKNFVISMSVGEQYLNVANYIGFYALCMTGFALTYMIANYFITKGSYKFLFILLFATILQVVSFLFRNESLSMVMQNQIVIYTILTLLTFVYLIFNLRSIENKKTKKEN